MSPQARNSQDDTTAENPTPDTSSSGLSRRRFLGAGATAAFATAAGAAMLAGEGLSTRPAAAQPASAEAPSGALEETAALDLDPAAQPAAAGTVSRRVAAYRTRTDAAQAEYAIPPQGNVANGDEDRYPNRIGNYHKGLPHDAAGEVEPAAYASLLTAVRSGEPSDFEAIVLGGPTKLTDPQAGLGFDLQGADPSALAIAPAPALASAEAAGEMVELLWGAMLRDVNFTDYATHPDVAAACADLNALSDFRGPRRNGRVTPQTLFRDLVPGGAIGPYLSQFLLLPAPFGAEYVERRIRTFPADTDQMTDFDEWLNVQNGGTPGGALRYDAQRRFVRNGRDIAAWVHKDVLFQAYFDACLILITAPDATEGESGGIGCPLNPGNPYVTSKTQVGFGTFGPPGIKGAMCEVAVRALKTTWHKKWFVHRRLRPEAFGGILHQQKAAGRYPGLLHPDLMGSEVLDRVHAKFGTYLHPQAFPEGCPTHPSYSAGHATVAGACVTMLKALFDETTLIPNPVVPSEDGLSLLPYHGPALTVGGELNKLASNISTGRNLAGVHWRSDAYQSLLLGEAVTLSILRDQHSCYNETRQNYFKGYTFTKFDGTRITA